MKIKLFTEAGLNSNEANVYKLLLEKGELTPPEAASLLRLGRQNSYAVFKSLERLGLAIPDKRHNKIVYNPGDPRILEGIIKNKKRRLETTEEQLGDSMSELSSFYNLAKNKSGISNFIGIEGIQTLYGDTLKKESDTILIISGRKPVKYLDLWLSKKYDYDRIAKKTEIRVLKKVETAFKNVPASQSKRIEGIPDNLEVLIYENNVSILNFSKKEPIGFTLDDKLFSALMKSIFEKLWEN